MNEVQLSRDAVQFLKSIHSQYLVNVQQNQGRKDAVIIKKRNNIENLMPGWSFADIMELIKPLTKYGLVKFDNPQGFGDESNSVVFDSSRLELTDLGIAYVEQIQ